MNTNILVISGTQHAQEILNNDALAAIKQTVTSTASLLALSATHTLCQDNDSLKSALADAQHYAGIVIDTGTLKHQSASLKDAIVQSAIPCIQVITDHKHQQPSTQIPDSVTYDNISSACVGVIGGFGIHSYELGITALNKIMATP